MNAVRLWDCFHKFIENVPQQVYLSQIDYWYENLL